VKAYTEALKRGPPSINSDSHKLYSNRAACYTKLTAYPEAVKDADKCIEVSPDDFEKGYTRKATAQFFMKEYNKAMTTYQKGLAKFPNSAEMKQGVMQCYQKQNAIAGGQASEAEVKEAQERAMSDPEIQEILSDVHMRQVLNDFQTDPAAAASHQKDPIIMNKIQKLAAAGVIQLR